MTEEHLTEELKEHMRPERVAPVVAWLMSPACSVTGEVIIAGGGRMGTARVCEPVPVEMADDADFTAMDQAWQQLSSLPMDQAYRGALQHSGSFLKVT